MIQHTKDILFLRQDLASKYHDHQTSFYFSVFKRIFLRLIICTLFVLGVDNYFLEYGRLFQTIEYLLIVFSVIYVWEILSDAGTVKKKYKKFGKLFERVEGETIWSDNKRCFCCYRAHHNEESESKAYEQWDLWRRKCHSSLEFLAREKKYLYICRITWGLLAKDICVHCGRSLRHSDKQVILQRWKHILDKYDVDEYGTVVPASIRFDPGW